MKTVGIVLIVAGILMLVYKGFNVQTDKRVVDIGPVEINKKENRWIGWPVYTGIISIAAGVVVMIADKKKTA
jgi:uncharacterized membrane protein HdeD (DUF308 family)